MVNADVFGVVATGGNGIDGVGDGCGVVNLVVEHGHIAGHDVAGVAACVYADDVDGA